MVNLNGSLSTTLLFLNLVQFNISVSWPDKKTLSTSNFSVSKIILNKTEVKGSLVFFYVVLSCYLLYD